MIIDNRKALLILSMLDNITGVKVKKLERMFLEPYKIFGYLNERYDEISKILGKSDMEKLLSISDELVDSYEKNLESQNIKFLTVYDDEYPQNFLINEELPMYLFCKGNINLLKEKGVAIVGSRAPCVYGRYVTEKFATSLAQAGLVVISGLATGVDKIAHESALKVGGKTIAVLGSGFNEIYPYVNSNLAKTISEKGLLVSEYKPSMKAAVYTFPTRNRIIAALSHGVLITQAGVKSGSFYTKDYGLSYGKPIFVVPGNINNQKSKGTNNLLRSYCATCVLDPEDILSELNVKFDQAPKQVQGDITENLILSALEDGEKTLEELQEKTNLETKVLNSALTMMHIRGTIKKMPGNLYIK